MKPIEEFMREFFKAHVDVELAKLAALAMLLFLARRPSAPELWR
jgi:hypothetical protein